jgi:hypothetical protein
MQLQMGYQAAKLVALVLAISAAAAAAFEDTSHVVQETSLDADSG